MSKQQSWQMSREVPKGSKGSRLGYGVFLLLLSAAGIGTFVYLQFPTAPRLFVRSFHFDDYGPFDVQARYIEKDVDRLAQLFTDPNEVTDGTSGGADSSFRDRVFQSHTDLLTDNFKPQILLNQIQSRDFSVIYLAAHGVSDAAGKTPYLMTGDDSSDPKRELEPLLQDIAGIGGGQKLVLLDAGQIHADLPQGIVTNAFPLALHNVMKEQITDRNLWVICSHGMFQNSQICETGDGSYFGKAVFDAFSELQSRDDSSISVGDLYREIHRRCVTYTLVTGENAQTPLLLRGQYGIVFDPGDDSLGLENEIMLASQIYTTSETDTESNLEDSGGKEVTAAAAAEDSKVADSGSKPEDSAAKVLVENPEASKLAQTWRLRDELQGRHHRFSPVDFAPNIWYGINERLIALERQRRRGVDTLENELLTDQDIARLGELAAVMRDRRPAKTAGDQSSNEFERLARAWNKFLADNSAVLKGVEGTASARIVDSTLTYRDMAFRSRYYAEWFERASIYDDLDLKDDIQALLIAIGNHRQLFSTTQFQDLETGLNTSAVARENAISQLTPLENRVLELWRAELNRIQAADSPDFSAEYFLAGLLESPVLGLTSFFGYPSKQDEFGLLARNSIEAIFQKMRATNRQDALKLAPISWPQTPWFTDHAVSALRHKKSNEDRADILRHYFAISDQKLAPLSISELPSNIESGWEDRVSGLLLEMFGGPDENANGGESQNAEDGFGKSIRSGLDQVVARNPHNWFDSIVLLPRQLRSINRQLKDGDFVASPFEFDIQVEQIVVEAIRRSERAGNIINFDDVETLTQVFSIASANDKSTRNVKLMLKIVPPELADAIAVKRDGQVVDAREPFDVSLSAEQFSLIFELAKDGGALVSGFSQTGEQKPKISLMFADAEIQDPLIRIEDPEQKVDFGVRFGESDEVSLFIRSEGADPDEQVAKSNASRITDKILELKPFVNRNRSFQFGLMNHSGRRKSVAVELYPIILPADLKAHTFPGEIPMGDDNQVHPAVKDLTLQRAKSGQQKFATSNSSIELDPQQQIFFKLIAPPAAPALEPVEGAKPVAKESAAPEQELPAAVELNNGFLCRLIEKDLEFGGDESTRDFWIQLALFDTSSLINQTAEFDPSQNPARLKINLALKQSDAPMAGNFKILIHSNLPTSQAEPLITVNPPKGIELNGQNYEGSFSVDLNLKAFERPDPIHIFVNINGESGVFVYELDENNLGPRKQVMDDIRPNKSVFDFIKAIPNPSDAKAEAVFPNLKFIDLLPPEKVAFQFLASFNDEDERNSSFQVEFGEVDNIPFRIVERTKHQLSFQMSAVNEETGTLDLTTAVVDHDFVFDGGSLEWAMNASILDGLSQQQTASQKFRFDNIAPTGQLDFGRDDYIKTLTVGMEAAVRIQGTDNLTGIERIELLLDADNNGEINEGDPVIDSRRNQATAEFTLATQKLVDDGLLKLGTNVLIARLIDTVGNKTADGEPVGPIELELKPPSKPAGSAAETKKKRTEFTVNIRVVWKSALDQPEDLPGSKISNVNLKSIDDEKGKQYSFSPPPQKNSYRFEKIPNGKYLVSGSGISTGRPSRDIRGHLEFEVKDADINEVLLPLEIGGKLEPDKKDEPEKEPEK